jgi:hypothetical protein
LTKKPNYTLTEETKLDFEKKAQLGFDRKKEKRNNFREHSTAANRRLKPHTQTQTGGGMRQCKRSRQSKKDPVLRLNESN